MTPPILRVAVPVPIGGCFDYEWRGAGTPPSPGVRVSVPFGRGRRIGVVVETATRSVMPAEKLRPVAEVLDAEPVLDAELISLLCWAADYYHHPIGEVFKHALPGLLRKGRPAAGQTEPFWTLTEQGKGVQPDALRPRAHRLAQALQALRAGPQAQRLLRETGVDVRALRRLESRGWARSVADESAAERNAGFASAPQGERSQPPALTAEQDSAVATIGGAAGRFAAFLLHGATGSGKTEVFLQLIARMLREGQQTLLLVPEIGLTPQLVNRLSDRFGRQLAVMHSALPDSERLDAWRRARNGTAGVIVGTRSAVFCPLAKAGLVIVDEEHDPSFKQQQGFHYSGRDLAVLRARRLSIPIVLASATPSLESFQNALADRYRLIEMPTRIGAAGQPRIRVVDLGRHASRRALSTPLLESIDVHLRAGNQVLLFLNRRGFAPALFCPDCHRLEECGRCDAKLTVHARRGELRCHHCGSAKPLSWACPECGTERIAVGAGTQRVTDELGALFPDYRIGRLDRDATSRRGTLDKVLADAASGAIQLLVGTQMLTKGHDFPRVTLVGVLNADQGLFGTEFRSEERLAQTLIQVAGRAGRRDVPGEVVIQTHYPEHPLLQRLLHDGYADFARLALAERQRSGWPPFTHVALWRAEGRRAQPVRELLERIGHMARVPRGDVRVLGPAPEPMERKEGRYRWRLLLEAPTRAPLHATLSRLLGVVGTWPEARRVRWSVDVDPIDV